MQEHEYKARDKTVQKMSRDGLREENLRNKEEKRITGRDTDTEISRSEKKEELDFSKRRHERLKEEREMEQPEQSSRKPRYSREHVSDQDINSDMGEEVEIEGDISVENGENPKSAFRTESIRGQPRGERAYLETVADSRDLRKKKMVRDYAAKERRKEKETSREEKAAKRESARYRETSEVMEDSLDKFHEEIKGKSKRERVLKEQRKKVSRLSFGDEGDGMVHGAGIGIRNPASAVKDAAVTAAHWKTHEEEDENAAVEGAHRAELVRESLARKSIYMRERLKGRREESRRLKESVLDEAERSRLIFETAYGNEAKDAVKREAEKKKKSPLTEQVDARLVLDAAASIPAPLARLLRQIHIHHTAVRILTTGGDAAQAAVRAGRTNAAVYGIYLALGRIFTVDYPEILILPDFFREEDDLYAESRITLRPVALLAFGAGFAFRLVKRRQEHEQTNDSPGQTAGADPE